MAFAQGKFGIEYNSNPIDEESSGAGWLVAIIVLAAIAVLAAAGVRRLISSPDADDGDGRVGDTPPPTTVVHVDEKSKSAGTSPQGDRSGQVGDAPLPPKPPPLPPGAERNRPRVAQNLLLKLEKAEAAHDVELAVSTIEQVIMLMDVILHRLSSCVRFRARRSPISTTLSRGDSESTTSAVSSLARTASGSRRSSSSAATPRRASPSRTALRSPRF